MNAPSPHTEQEEEGDVFLDESDIIQEIPIDEEELPDADDERDSDADDPGGPDDSIHIFTGHTRYCSSHVGAAAGIMTDDEKAGGLCLDAFELFMEPRCMNDACLQLCKSKNFYRLLAARCIEDDRCEYTHICRPHPT